MKILVWVKGGGVQGVFISRAGMPEHASDVDCEIYDEDLDVTPKKSEEIQKRISEMQEVA